jgi:tyrosyl-tRNA synthetase
VWLDPQRTSTYRFYQFFIQTDDGQAGAFLRKLTLIPREETEALEQEVAANPGARSAQKRLAREMTTLVHGGTACDDAVNASNVLFGGDPTGVSAAALEEIAGEVPAAVIARSSFGGVGTNIVDLLATSGLCPSKAQARKDIQGGGIYVNNQRVDDVTRAAGEKDLLHERFILLRKGKKNYLLVRTID